MFSILFKKISLQYENLNYLFIEVVNLIKIDLKYLICNCERS